MDTVTGLDIDAYNDIDGWYGEPVQASGSTRVVAEQGRGEEDLIDPPHLSSESELLVLLLQQLRPPLRRFVTGVLDGEIGHCFRALPASRSYHHAQNGGLLQHSLECALMAGQVAFTWLSRAEAEVTLVAALFHDIGKCRTHRQDGLRTALGHYVSHEAYALELLGPHLMCLERSWPNGAHLLRHMLSQDKSGQMFPSFPGTLLVRMADQMSTALNRRKALFQQRPAHHHYLYDAEYQQAYLRLVG